MRDIPREILIEASEGSMNAFESVYRASSDYVYTIALKITGSHADAEEVTQDVFITIYRKLKRFRFKSSFKTWLYRITVNSAISVLRKTAKRRSRHIEYDDAIKVEGGHDATREAIESENNESRVRSMLEALNPDQRACIVLREIDGLRYKDIADVLKININTVRSRLRRARNILIAREKQEG